MYDAGSTCPIEMMYGTTAEAAPYSPAITRPAAIPVGGGLEAGMASCQSCVPAHAQLHTASDLPQELAGDWVPLARRPSHPREVEIVDAHRRCSLPRGRGRRRGVGRYVHALHRGGLGDEQPPLLAIDVEGGRDARLQEGLPPVVHGAHVGAEAHDLAVARRVDRLSPQLCSDLLAELGDGDALRGRALRERASSSVSSASSAPQALARAGGAASALR
eukprot:CAMPEP_0179862532 /NCGR_PEP_ID=MMETSP0982-20121206/14938_1 /TAXON_ID=483367 /ORGANISM="non described non described, Strain CCMP 2436" /LENGTH=217 /DNA_ID=CAMNT_0021750333 /DNA_START=253 /DNA_END=905 /DNA_ORIENTATION=-